MQPIKTKYRLIPVREPQSERKRGSANVSDTKLWEISMSDERPTIVPNFNLHNRQILDDCICVFCGFRFVPQKTRATEFMSDTYSGLDYCQSCCGQGGIIRTYGVELSQLPRIRAAVIDLIATQNRKMRWCSNAAKEIDPVWECMITGT